MPDSQRYDEQQLLQRLAAGDESAFRILFDSYRNKLYTYFCKLSGSSEQAEDTVHDVFLKLWQRREQLRDVQHLAAYLYRMMHNQAYDQLRQMAKETLVLAVIQKEQGLAIGHEGEDRLTHQEVSAFIRDAVSRLTEQQKKVFLLSRQEGLKHAEIAERLGITERTVKNHIADALKFLRGEISRRYGGNALIIIILYQLSLEQGL